MTVPSLAQPPAFALASCATALLAALGACGPGVSPGAGCPDPIANGVVAQSGIDRVDLLVEVDNSGGMSTFQSHFVPQLAALETALTAPPDADHNGRPDAPPVRSLHVAVIDPDLGTPGSDVAGCNNGDKGDDGLLNPIRYGQAEAHHEPLGIDRPADCTDPNQFPSFLAFDPSSTDPSQAAHDLSCNAYLGIDGCGIEQPLESIWRAVIWNDATDAPGNQSPNAGFLRDDAVLAIVVLTDEEDTSVVDCRYVVPPGHASCPNPGALGVFDSSSHAWASTDLNLRDYLDQPCGPQDPTWPLDRYVDPRDPGAGFYLLAHGHPERIVFAAITGVPLAGDGFPTNADGTTDWDRLLGTPSANGPDDFCGRNAGPTGESVDTDSAEGHVSMRQANLDPNCSTRVVPACRLEGTTDDPAMPACAIDRQPFGWPARRIVEVARRFDQAPLCEGAPCHNGLVSSIFANDLGPAVGAITERIRSHLESPCAPRPLPRVGDAGPYDCTVTEYVPAASAAGCDPSRGRGPTSHGPSVVRHDGVDFAACEVAQVSTDGAGAPIAGQAGWYVAGPRGPDDACEQRVEFTPGAEVAGEGFARIECRGWDTSCP